jgi:hypothetical protein
VDFLSLEQSATLLGAYRWIELRSFELLGGWVTSTSELEVKLCFAEQSHHHAWHASLWADRFPVLSHLDRDRYLAPPGDAWPAFLDQLNGRPTGTAERLIGLYQVLIPAKLALYHHHLQVASAVADGPIIRSLRQVIQDENADLQSGTALIGSVLAGVDTAELSGAYQEISATLSDI